MNGLVSSKAETQKVIDALTALQNLFPEDKAKENQDETTDP